jgi:predicted HicB family RNase H-like nuclease
LCYFVFMVNTTEKNKLTFSIRIPSDLLERITKMAEEKRWSNNQTICYMLEQQASEKTDEN